MFRVELRCIYYKQIPETTRVMEVDAHVYGDLITLPHLQQQKLVCRLLGVANEEDVKYVSVSTK